MTDKQHKFIEYLIDQIGFRNSPKRDQYLSIIWNRYQGRDDASKMIDKLLEEKELRNSATKRKYNPKHIAVTNLSAFAFCPASYVISETYNIEKTEQMLEGEELHNKRFLNDFLYNLRNKRLRQIEEEKIKDDKAEKFLYRGYYGDLLKSELSFEGHLADNGKIFYSDNNTLAGVPDYIFNRTDNKRFVVEEKHTWRKEKIKKPFHNHVIQILGYIHGLKSLKLSHGYILYFHWGWFKGSLRSTDVDIYKVTMNNSDKYNLVDVYKSVRTLKDGVPLEFNVNDLNMEKCFGCGVRALCNHKSGRYNKIQYPYYRCIN